MEEHRKKSLQQWLLIVAILLLVFLLISFTELFSKRRSVQDTISSLRQEITQLEKKNKQLLDLADYLSTRTFVESQAREKFNLTKPDEGLIIIKESDIKDPSEDLDTSDVMAIRENLSNPYKWRDYFFH